MKKIFLIISVFALFLTAGCGKPSGEKAQYKYNSLVDKGLALYHSCDYRKALACFEKAMVLTTKNDNAYLYSALICDEMMDDPHKAKVYYEKFIEITDDIKKRELAKTWLNNLYGRYGDYKESGETEKDSNMSDKKSESEKLAELREKMNQLNRLNDNLKRELAAVQQELYDRNRAVSGYLSQIEILKSRIASVSITDSYRRQVSNLTGDSSENSPYVLSLFTDVGFYEQKNNSGFLFRKYIVKSGESLLSISHKVYGDERYWSLLKETNKFQLPEDGSIHEGQILIIPKLPEKIES